ncbi:MAG: peptide chain release factor 1 [Clostridia bacterium]|nr:peptide chain release factor 1 [Clostridia bacterium]
MNTQRLESVVKRYEELSAQVFDPKVIADVATWTKIVKEQKSLEPIVETYESLKKAEDDLKQAREIIASETDPEMRALAEEEEAEKREEVQKKENELKILLLPADPDDNKDIIMEIRGGAGGDEAALFAAELMRMYKMFAQANRWKVEDIDVNETELGGVKEAVFSISGENVYSKLKFESGVHRVQRVPETETQGRIHTSTVTVAVLPQVEDVNVEINEKDLKIDTYRSGGAGGQHVNKTDSAVRMTHLPTGIVVQCQDERSQIKNREKAMRVLKSKLYDLMKREAEEKYASGRRSQVGTGDRSERIRTYNFPQGRVTDHRIGLTLHSLDTFLNGDIGEMTEGLRIADQTAKLNSDGL